MDGIPGPGLVRIELSVERGGVRRRFMEFILRRSSCRDSDFTDMVWSHVWV